MRDESDLTAGFENHCSRGTGRGGFTTRDSGTPGLGALRICCTKRRRVCTATRREQSAEFRRVPGEGAPRGQMDPGAQFRGMDSFRGALAAGSPRNARAILLRQLAPRTVECRPHLMGPEKAADAQCSALMRDGLWSPDFYFWS